VGSFRLRRSPRGREPRLSPGDGGGYPGGHAALALGARIEIDFVARRS